MNVGAVLDPSELDKMLNEINIELTQQELDHVVEIAERNGKYNDDYKKNSNNNNTSSIFISPCFDIIGCRWKYCFLWVYCSDYQNS